MNKMTLTNTTLAGYTTIPGAYKYPNVKKKSAQPTAISNNLTNKPADTEVLKCEDQPKAGAYMIKRWWFYLPILFCDIDL
jgi:hypothetical protein